MLGSPQRTHASNYPVYRAKGDKISFVSIERGPYSSFQFGFQGAWTMASLVAEAQGNSNKVTQYLGKVQTCFDDVIDGIEQGLTVSKKYDYDLTDLVVYVYECLGGEFFHHTSFLRSVLSVWLRCCHLGAVLRAVRCCQNSCCIGRDVRCFQFHCVSGVPTSNKKTQKTRYLF